MFRDCGWDYMQEYVGFRYFKKSADSMSGEENIFSDDESRAAMMDRIYKNRLLPIFWIFFLCLIPQFVVNLSSQRYGVAVIYGVFLTLYAVVLVRCAIKYRDIKRK
jgi:threonine/homoserine/homoserine lactone efflux protein